MLLIPPRGFGEDSKVLELQWQSLLCADIDIYQCRDHLTLCVKITLGRHLKGFQADKQGVPILVWTES